MIRRSDKAGFTLLEILVATAIIVMIVSMVYGSYHATSKSTDIYKGKMTQSQRARGALQQMARQIRCSYAPQHQETTRESDEATQGGKPMLSPQRKAIWRRATTYFHSEPSAAAGEILRFITMKGAPTEPAGAHGLYEVAYTYNPYTATIFRRQKRFVGAFETSPETADHQVFLTNVDRIELQFYDGQQWFKRWDSARAKRLPRAVRINITIQDGNRQQFQYSTTAYVACWKPANEGSVSEESTLVTSQ